MKKDKVKNIIIISLIVIVLLLIVLIVGFIVKPKQKIDGSSMTSSELIEMLESENYEINLTNIDKYTYIELNNKLEGITIQKIPNTLSGTLMTFDDDTINDQMADILNISSNNTDEEQEQYNAFKSWLKYYNVTKEQISDMLDYYYNINKDKVEHISTEELLK